MAADNKDGSENHEASEKLLLAQFSEVNQDWRHFDTKIERALSLYVSVCTFASSLIIGTPVFYGGSADIQSFLQTAAILSPFLVILGVFTARRVKNASISRDRRQFAINLVKVYFQNNDPVLGSHLPVHKSTPRPLRGMSDKDKKDDEDAQAKISYPDGIVSFIFAVNTILVAVGILGLGSLVDLFACSVDTSIAIVGAECFLGFEVRRYQRSKRTHRTKYRERIKSRFYG